MFLRNCLKSMTPCGDGQKAREGRKEGRNAKEGRNVKEQMVGRRKDGAWRNMQGHEGRNVKAKEGRERGRKEGRREGRTGQDVKEGREDLIAWAGKGAARGSFLVAEEGEEIVWRRFAFSFASICDNSGGGRVVVVVVVMVVMSRW